MRYAIRLLAVPLLLSVGVVVATAGPASAATSLVANPATVAGSTFTWTCSVNPGGGTTYVAGASWLTVGGADFIETPRTAVTGSATTTVTFHRDGGENQAYQYPCKTYATPTKGTATNSNKLDLTTYGNTRYGLLVATVNDYPNGGTFADWVSAYTEHRALLGGTSPLGVRVYSGSNPAVPLATDTTMAGKILNWVALHEPDESITVSFKQYDATRLNTLLTWAQTNSIDLTVIYYHEVQDNWGKSGDPAASPAVYTSVYRQMRTVIDAHPWKAHITLEKNLMWYWQYFQVATLGADWHEYVASKVNGVKVDPADRVSWDAYQPLQWTEYATPAQFMQYALAVWQEAGVPWGYGEIGAVPRGAPDAAWVAATQAFMDAARTPALAGAAYAALPPAQTFKYWCAKDNNQIDSYHLEQNPAAVTLYQSYLANMPQTG